MKIQFFKSFILPYFDYCLSLIILFPKATIQNMSYAFNNCLYKLFKFNSKLEEDRKISNSDNNRYNNSSQKYGFLSFQYRILNKFLLSLYNVKNNCNSPLILKKSLNIEQNCVNINDNLMKLIKTKIL